MTDHQNRPGRDLDSAVAALDLTAELDRTTQRVRQLEAELERLHRLSLAGRVAGALAHEFNNILTPILNYAEMALAAPDDRELSQKALERAYAGSRHAARVASSILTLVSGSEGMFHVEHSEDGSCRVSDAVEEAVACLARPPARDGVELAVRVPGELWAGMDVTSLSQVVLNLLLNGVEAMRPGGGLLEVFAGQADGDIRIEVSDTGRGIEASRLGSIFEPFARGMQASDASGGDGEARGGAGLGLSICRRLVERAGGRIRARSVVGEGTTFTVELPRAVEGREAA